MLCSLASFKMLNYLAHTIHPVIVNMGHVIMESSLKKSKMKGVLL